MSSETDTGCRILPDARAVLKTSDLRADVRGRVIPGFCRMALEAVCTAAVRERRLRKGMPHAAVDALLDEHVKPRARAT